MKNKLPYFISITVSLCIWAALFFLIDSNKFIKIYDDRLQFAFFTGFLTVGSLLLAMKAFLLVRLKDDIYLHEEYKRRYKEQCLGSYKKHNIDYFQGLKDIGYLLVISVIGSFVTAIAQVTIGFCTVTTVKIIAPSLAAGMLTMVVIDWWYVYLNLKDWFSFIEKDIQAKLESELPLKKES